MVASVTQEEVEEQSAPVFVCNTLTGEDLELDVLSVQNTANVLGKTPKTFRSWVTKGVMPPPIYESIDRVDFRYYTVEEVLTIARVLERNSDSMRFLKEGTPVVVELFQEISSIRS